MFKRIQDWLMSAPAQASAPTAAADTGLALDATLAAPPAVLGAGVNLDAELLTRSNIQTRFKPVRELGRGGTSSVHDASDLCLARHTALKVLHSELAERPGLRAQFITEAQITAQLEHPNIVPVYEFGQDAEGVPYINMRKVDGATFERFVLPDDRARLDPQNIKTALRVLLRVCDALAYAHSRGVIHRDIKPANVMVGEFGEVYLMDWGIALASTAAGVSTPRIAAASDASPGSSSSRVAGTPAYMSPEQTSGDPNVITSATDVFLVGATLYQLLTGHPPYTGATTLGEVLQQAERCEFQPVDAVSGAVRAPAALVHIVEQAMQRDPAARFADMTEMRRAIEAFLEGTSHLGLERYSAGQMIVREGDGGDRAYIIASGQCEVFVEDDGVRRALRTIGPGEVFGEMAILSGGVRTSSVIALTAVELEVVTRGSLHDGLGLDSWAGRFVTALADRFIDVDRQAREVRS
ncbi:MAG: cyclic nucleotide-binding domain-containing protein [Pseudomonadota bacterium]